MIAHGQSGTRPPAGTITDPVALIIAEIALLVAAACASFVPSLRATKADPMDVLRAI